MGFYQIGKKPPVLTLVRVAARVAVSVLFFYLQKLQEQQSRECFGYRAWYVHKAVLFLPGQNLRVQSTLILRHLLHAEFGSLSAPQLLLG